MSGDWRAKVLNFWFGLEPEQWWRADPELDERIRHDFLELWHEKRQLPVDAFLADPVTAAAAVILFDQFPRNMFRGHADAYSTDPLALGIAKEAVAKGFDKKLAPAERKFLYMPFQHSEKIEDQNRAILLHRTRRRSPARLCEAPPRHHRAFRTLSAPQCDPGTRVAAGRDCSRGGKSLVTDLVEAARFNSRVEADLARLYLESEGVQAVLFDTEINYFYGGLFLPVRLMVIDEDLDRAQELLASVSG